MLSEAEFNTAIKNSLLWASKIPDPSGDYVKSTSRAFDGFGVWDGKPLYWEAKFQKKLAVFDLGRIEDHQIDNLCALKGLIPGAECWILWGVYVGRGDMRVYRFTNPFEIKMRRDERDNIKKKEVELLPYFSIKKNLVIWS